MCPPPIVLNASNTCFCSVIIGKTVLTPAVVLVALVKRNRTQMWDTIRATDFGLAWWKVRHPFPFVELKVRTPAALLRKPSTSRERERERERRGKERRRFWR